MKHRLVLNSLLGVNDLYVDMSKQMIIHYSKYPISEFVLTLNGNESQIRRFRDFLRGINVRMRIFPNTLVYDNRRQARWSNQRQAYIRDRYSEHDWKISVDSDEILLMNDVLYDTLDCTDYNTPRKLDRVIRCMIACHRMKGAQRWTGTCEGATTQPSRPG